MKSVPKSKAIAVSLLEGIEEERLLWLIITFIQGLLNNQKQ